MPQSAGQSHVHVVGLHSLAPSQTPQSAGQRNSHVDGSQMDSGPCATAPPQSAGQAKSQIDGSHANLGDGATAWPLFGWLAVPATMLLVLTRPGFLARWPMREQPALRTMRTEASLMAPIP